MLSFARCPTLLCKLLLSLAIAASKQCKVMLLPQGLDMTALWICESAE